MGFDSPSHPDETVEQDKFESSIIEAAAVARERLALTTDLAEAMCLVDALRILNPTALAWTKQHITDPAQLIAQFWINEYIDSRLEGFEAEAAIARELLPLLNNGEEPLMTDKARIVVKRIENYTESFGRSIPNHQYRLLATFANGDCGSCDVQKPDQESPILYQVLQAPCCHQACEAILRNQEGEGDIAIIDVDNLKYNTLWQLVANGGGQQQVNFAERNESGDVVATRDPSQYLLFALKNGFSNEVDRFNVLARLN